MRFNHPQLMIKLLNFRKLINPDYEEFKSNKIAKALLLLITIMNYTLKVKFLTKTLRLVFLQFKWLNNHLSIIIVLNSKQLRLTLQMMNPLTIET